MFNDASPLRNTTPFYRENSVFLDYQYEAFKPLIRIVEVGASHWLPGAFYALKSRQYFSINFVSRGNAYFEQRDFQGMVQPGQLYLAHVGCTQSSKPGDQGFLTKRFIRFEGELLQSHLMLGRLLEVDVVTPVSSVRMKQLFKQCYQLMREKPGCYIEKLSSLAYQILMDLSKSVVDRYPAQLTQGIAYVNQNLHRPLTLAEIAKAMGVGIRQCTRLFQSHLQLSPIQFVHFQKHSWAKNMLGESQMSVKDIAEKLGYDDPLYFSARFKKYEHVSPTHYRSLVLK